MRDVFISHVEEDQAVALEIARGLRAAGYTTWCYEEDSLPGPAYLLQTGEAIDGCRAVVLIISPDSLSSNQVTVEVVRAHESGKPFFPILRGITHPEFQARQPLWRQALGAASSIALPPGGVDAILPRLVAGLKALQVEPGQAPPLPQKKQPEPPRGPAPKLQVGRWVWAAGGVLALAVVAYLAVRLVGPLPHAGPTQARSATATPAGAATAPTAPPAAGAPTQAVAAPTGAPPATAAPAAPPLQALAVFKGRLEGAGDTKYHQVTVPAGQHLIAVFDAADNRYANDLYIRFGSLPTREQYDDKGDLPGADQAVEIAGTQAGTYNLMAYSKDYSVDYTLTVYDESSFPSLAPGTQVSGKLVGGGDVKYHQIATAAGEHLTVLLDAADNRYANELYIKFGSLPSIERFDVKGGLPGADQAVEIASTQAGIYYVMLRARDYDVDYTLTAYDDASFPALAMGTPLTGKLVGGGDYRFYQVATAAGEHLAVLLDAADNRYANDLYIRFGSLPTTELYDAKGGLPGADQAVEIASTQAGIYYVMLHARDYDVDYTLTAHNAGTFPSLALGTPLTGKLVGGGDREFYQIATAAGQRLTVLLDAADNRYANDLFIRFGSLPSTEQYDDKGDAAGADQAVEIASTQAGTYYIMLHARDYDVDYTLTAQ